MKGWQLVPFNQCPKLREDAPFMPLKRQQGDHVEWVGQLVWIHDSWIVKEEEKKFLSHQTLSFIKSGIRIAGYFALAAPTGTPPIVFVAVVLLVLSEVLGIVEEIGH